MASNLTFHSTQTTDCFYIPASQGSLFQVKAGIDVASALMEAQAMTSSIREMLYNYRDYETAAFMAGNMLCFVEGLIESAQASLRQVR